LMLKAKYGVSDAGFDAFLSIIADMLPKENNVPANTYYAKKLMLWGQYVWPQVGRSLTHTDLSLHSLIESKRAYVKVKVSNGIIVDQHA
jgi:hypothetical protein